MVIMGQRFKHVIIINDRIKEVVPKAAKGNTFSFCGQRLDIVGLDKIPAKIAIIVTPHDIEDYTALMEKYDYPEELVIPPTNDVGPLITVICRDHELLNITQVRISAAFEQFGVVLKTLEELTVIMENQPE